MHKLVVQGSKPQVSSLVELAGRFNDEVTDIKNIAEEPVYILLDGAADLFAYIRSFVYAWFMNAATNGILDADSVSEVEWLMPEDLASNHQFAQLNTPSIRVLKRKNDILATVVAGNLDIQVSELISKLQSRTTLSQYDIVRKMLTNVNKLNQAILNPSSVDFKVQKEQIFRSMPGLVNGDEALGVDETYYPDWVAPYFEFVRFIRPPYKKIGTITLPSGTVPASFENLMKLPNDYQFFSAGSRLLSGALDDLAVCFSFSMPPALVEYVTQTKFSEVKLQFVQAWLRNLLDNQFGNRDDGYLESLTPISRIAAINEAGTVRMVKRTNEAGLGMTTRGDPIYIPEIDARTAVAVEEEVESSHTTASGEFAGFDLVDPEATHYELTLDKAGSQRQTKKRAGAFMCVYTDWRAGMFSFTDEHGALRVLDVNQVRPLSNGHIYKLASERVSTKFALNGLSLLGKLAAFFGFEIKLQADELAWLGETGSRQALSTLDQYKAEGILSLIRHVSDRAYSLRFNRERDTTIDAATIKWIDEDFSALGDLSLGDISTSSPALPLRAIARCLIEVTDFALANLNKATGADGIGVNGAMRALAIGAIIKHYGGKRRQYYEADMKDRELYENPPLTPLKELKIGGIPFVKDLTLMPHQVKVLNYLKNLPKHAVIDVAAGGGKCLVGSTLVPTNRGLLSLREIWESAEGENSTGFRKLTNTVVESLEGHTDAVAVYRKPGKHSILKVTLADGTEFSGLPEHRLWNGREWVFFKDVSIGTRFPRYEHVQTLVVDKEPTLPKMLCATQLPTELNEQLSFYLGAIVAEGVGVCPCNTDEKYLAAMRKAYYFNFGARPKERVETTSNGKTLITLVPHNSDVRLFLETLCPSVPSWQRTVPRIVRQGTSASHRQFLRAYFEGDGCLLGSESGEITYEVSATSISKKLVRQVRAMLIGLGLEASYGACYAKSYRSTNGTVMGYGEAIETTRTPCTVTISKNSLADFAKSIGFVSDSKTSHLKACLANQRDVVENGQRTNHTRRGYNNFLGEEGTRLYRECISLLSSTAATFSREVAFGASHRQVDYTLATVIHDLKTTGIQLTRPQYLQNVESATRWHVEALEDLLSHKHPVLADVLTNKDFVAAYGALKQLTNFTWVEVVSVHETKPKVVYDLHVPKSNSYIAEGFMSHNTIIAMVDIALNMGAGKVKKPLVLCPSDLKKNYFNDGNIAFAGRVNFVMITTDTVANWGYDELRKLINSAPINTIFITDFDFIKGKKIEYGYGTKSVTSSLNMEFLREFAWDGLWVDEVHKVKNSLSLVTRMAMQLANSIDIIRQMSGTYLPDTYEDVVALFAQLDPTVFGDNERFMEEFQDPNKGRGAWIEGAGRKINQRMSKNCNLVTIKRREWKAMLPLVIEAVHVKDVVLTDKLKSIYEIILEEELEAIRAEIANDPKLKEMFEKQNDDEELEKALEEFLESNTFMQRLEEFLCNPKADEAGFALTEEEDIISPKIRKAYDICTSHIKQKIPGKIIVFCKYHSTANAFADYAPAHLKKHVVHYVASGGVMSKEDYIQQFKSDPNKLIMVGVEDSLNTGHNFQFASRLIRMQSVWNWGQLEQGEARILRPNVKTKKNPIGEFRTNIYMDWIICNETVDVTKACRMIKKLIDIAKFYEKDDPRFHNLGEDLPKISMSLASIKARNSIDDPVDEKSGKTMWDFIASYNEYREAEEASFEDFKRSPEALLEAQEVPEGEMLPGSGILQKVPYIGGIELYGMDKLGLVPLNVYLAEKPKNFDPVGLTIHTEDGEFPCTTVTNSSCKIRSDAGRIVSYTRAACFVVTRKTADASAIRAKIAKMVGTKTDVVVDLAPNVPKSKMKELKTLQLPTNEKQPNAPVPNTDLELNNKFSVFALGYNQYCAIGVSTEDPDVPVEKLKEKFNFVHAKPFNYIHMKSARHYVKWLEAVESKFSIPDSLMEGLNHIRELWLQHKDFSKFMRNIDVTKLKAFILSKFKPCAKNEVKPYVIFENDNVFVCVDTAAHASSFQALKRIQVPGETWSAPDAHEMFSFCKNKQEARKLLYEMGKFYTITNLAKVTKQINESKSIGQ